ncbi:hypothetical protein HOP51_17520 [Halomonas sp. MCCC 1A11036]|uniref:Uncharacterized protein n=1 Tax=Billgrantia zhangzhouensis TaxID=2733481 RepID=A0ABS9AJI7_9GAMM|nr:hypothetical protein [Halomonas zhangzhouensis]MCE8021899.1 hypothetical protein [Halomonas zhangzhouensis]
MSIYDLLSQRYTPDVEPQEPAGQHDDYRTDRLRLVDGVAVTPAGMVAGGEVPERTVPVVSPVLQGPDGFRLLVHAVKDVVPVEEPRLARHSAKALRLHALIQTISLDALMLLEALPEGAGFDIVVSAPLRSAEAAEVVIDRLGAMVAASAYAAGLGTLHHSDGGRDPHTVLGVQGAAGQPYVLWIGADSLLDHDDIAGLHRQGLLALASRQAGMFPGEAAYALLVQRIPESGEDGPAPGWWLEAATRLEHPARDTLSLPDRQRLVGDLLARVWPEGEDGEACAPASLVMDTLELPGRVPEVLGPLLERWPALDVIEHGLSVSALCGWPGEALVPLQWVLALASLDPGEDALLLNLAEPNVSHAMALHACAPAATPNEAPPAPAAVDRRRS